MCKSVYLTISLLLSAVLVGCNNHNHAGHSHDDGHEHSEYEHHHDDDEHDHDGHDHDGHEKDDCEDKKVNVINGHSHNEDFHSKDEEGIKKHEGEVHLSAAEIKKSPKPAIIPSGFTLPILIIPCVYVH